MSYYLEKSKKRRKKEGYVFLMKAINIVQWKLQKKENDKKKRKEANYILLNYTKAVAH
jgi:hypothetical protein